MASKAAARARIEQQQTWVDMQVNQAMERGDFDDLPGAGKPIPVYGDGTAGRDYTFISDILDGIIACTQKEFGYEIFNLGESQIVPLSQMIELLEKALGIKAIFDRQPLQRHRSAFRFRNVHERLKHDEHAVALLEAVRERVAEPSGIGRSGEGHFGSSAKTGQRRPQIVGDIVEGLAHPGDEPFDPVQHRVEKLRQLADGIVISPRPTG